MNANQLLTIEDEYDGVSIYIVHVCPYLWKSECTVRKSAQLGRFLHVHFIDIDYVLYWHVHIYTVQNVFIQHQCVYMCLPVY